MKGPPEVAHFIEDYLIQGDHFRGDYPKQEALDENKLNGKQLAALTQRYRLLRIVHRTDTARIELIHDRLVPVIRKGREERRMQTHQRQTREAQIERDRERTRSEELERQRDAANRSLKAATRNRNIALVMAGFAVVMAIVIFFVRKKGVGDHQTLDVAVATSHLAEGRLGLQGGSEPWEQTMYRGLAAYRLAGRGLSAARAASRTALFSVLDASGHLRRL